MYTSNNVKLKLKKYYGNVVDNINFIYNPSIVPYDIIDNINIPTWFKIINIYSRGSKTSKTYFWHTFAGCFTYLI